jgi:cupin fold WbuC family metalloprotein
MISITENLLKEVSQKARLSPRKRLNHNFHTDLADTFQRMLNCIEPGTYCKPHKHEDPPKREVFIILKGSAVVVQFDDSGNITEHIRLENRSGNYGVEIPPSTWHTIISLEPGTVVYECKDGPYSPLTDKDFATWAPEEYNPDCKVYNANVLKQLGLKEIIVSA